MLNELMADYRQGLERRECDLSDDFLSLLKLEDFLDDGFLRRLTDATTQGLLPELLKQIGFEGQQRASEEKAMWLLVPHLDDLKSLFAQAQEGRPSVTKNG
jgi:hypothetical protein